MFLMAHLDAEAGQLQRRAGAVEAACRSCGPPGAARLLQHRPVHVPQGGTCMHAVLSSRTEVTWRISGPCTITMMRGS